MIKTPFLGVHKDVATFLEANLHSSCLKFKNLLKRGVREPYTAPTDTAISAQCYFNWCWHRSSGRRSPLRSH